MTVLAFAFSIPYSFFVDDGPFLATPAGRPISPATVSDSSM